MKILRTILIVLGILALVNVLFLFRVSNPTIGLALQLALAIFIIAYAVFFNHIPRKVHYGLWLCSLIPLVFAAFLFVYGNVSNVNHNEDVVIVLVTNDFHIYRGVRTARAVGLDVTRMGAPTDWYTWPVNYLREMLAVVNMWLR